MWVGALAQGPQGGSLHCVYKNMETWTFQDEMGETVLKVCQVSDTISHMTLLTIPSPPSLNNNFVVIIDFAIILSIDLVNQSCLKYIPPL